MDEYQVTLLIGCEARGPQAALDDFIESILVSGLRSWVYVITNQTDNEVYYSDGWGNLMDEAAMKRYVSDRMAGLPVPQGRITDPEDDESNEDYDYEEGEEELETDENRRDADKDDEAYDALVAKLNERSAPQVVTVDAAVLNAAMEQVSDD